MATRIKKSIIKKDMKSMLRLITISYVLTHFNVKYDALPTNRNLTMKKIRNLIINYIIK